MSTAVYVPARPRPLLRPIALPTEHGGWGFLIEPILLAMLVAPSRAGALVALAYTFGFLTRQPLRFALQDARRGRAYPRTRWCWLFAAAYAAAALLALAAAISLRGWTIIIPIGLVAPMGLTQILYDAHNRSRSLLPELAGAAAMCSSAAAIGIAVGMRIVPALALSGIVIARAIPSIVYVRTVLGHTKPKWIALALHAAAIALVALFAPMMAVVAMALLFVRAAWGLSHPPPRAQQVGWTEIVFGLVTVLLAAAPHLVR
ncbi:MAG TPA: YwiC-like family protein [Thermoanaerobaculia bacterium]